MELQQVYLMTADLERTKAFYKTLGFEISDEGSRSVEFETGRAKLKLEADFDAETLSAFGLDSPSENRGDGAVIVLAVEDVDAVADAADTATDEYGGEVLTGTRNVDWGRRLLLLADPDGYVLELSQSHRQ